MELVDTNIYSVDCILLKEQLLIILPLILNTGL